MIFPSGGNYHGVCHPPHDFYLEELQVKLRPVSSQFWGAGPSLLCVAANIFTDKQLEIHSFYHTASWFVVSNFALNWTASFLLLSFQIISGQGI